MGRLPVNQLDALIKQLRQLPYADMMELAEVVREQLVKRHADAGISVIGQRSIADVLSAIQIGSVPQSEVTTAEQRILREIFTRKRQVTINKQGAGYAMEILTVPGSQVLGTDLRVIFPQMLDQITTLSALKR